MNTNPDHNATASDTADRRTDRALIILAGQRGTLHNAADRHLSGHCLVIMRYSIIGDLQT